MSPYYVSNCNKSSIWHINKYRMNIKDPLWRTTLFFFHPGSPGGESHFWQFFKEVKKVALAENWKRSKQEKDPFTSSCRKFWSWLLRRKPADGDQAAERPIAVAESCGKLPVATDKNFRRENIFPTAFRGANDRLKKMSQRFGTERENERTTQQHRRQFLFLRPRARRCWQVRETSCPLVDHKRGREYFF